MNKFYKTQFLVLSNFPILELLTHFTFTIIDGVIVSEWLNWSIIINRLATLARQPPSGNQTDTYAASAKAT